MNKAPGRLFYVILSGMILIALIIYSAPTVAAGPSPKGTVVPAMPSEEPPPTNTPMPSPTPTGIPSYFSNPGGPSCVGGGCTLPSGYNVVVSAIRNEQSLQAYDPKTGSVFGTGRVETTILVSGAGIGTVSVYYGLSGVSCSGGHSVDIAKRSGNETHLNVPLSGYVDVTLTSLDFGEFTIYTRCKTAGSYVGNFGIDSVWYSLVDVATPTPTAAPTSTPTATPKPTKTPTGSGTCWASGPSWASYTVNYDIDLSIPTTWISSIENSAQTWNNVQPTYFAFVRQIGSSNTIKYQVPDNPAYIGGTSAQPPDGPFVIATTKLNPNYSWDTNNAFPSSTAYNVQNIMTHEFGHWLYLDDIDSQGCEQVTMWWSAGLGETKKIDLDLADANGINWLYP